MRQVEVLRRSLLRRRFLQLSGLSSASFLLGGCATTLFQDVVNKTSEPFNQKVESLIFNPQKLAPEFPLSAIQPKALLVNTYDQIPDIDTETFRLIIDGEVNHPLSLSMADIQRMPLTSMIIRHVCVEGWAAIVQWGGIRLRDLLHLAQPKANARYVYFKSADDYYESWDLPSATHPQTIMAYQKNGQPLSVENGAPIRLASPIKLGYKQSKWVTRITLVDNLRLSKGYWVDQGYEWYGGL